MHNPLEIDQVIRDRHVRYHHEAYQRSRARVSGDRKPGRMGQGLLRRLVPVAGRPVEETSGPVAPGRREEA